MTTKTQTIKEILEDLGPNYTIEGGELWHNGDPLSGRYVLNQTTKKEEKLLTMIYACSKADKVEGKI